MNSSPNHIPWRRVAVEGLVIVGSILLAFWIDAAWDSREERAEERFALEGLEEDFQGYLRIIESGRGPHAARMRAAETILAVVGPQAGRFDGAELQEGLSHMIRYQAVILPPGTLGTLTASRGMSLLKSVELRRALTDWLQDLEALAGSNRFNERVAVNLGAYLRPRFPNRNLGLNFESGGGVGARRLPGRVDPSLSRFPTPMNALLQDVEFEKFVAMGSQSSFLMLQDLDVLEAAALRILDLVNQELN